MVVLDTDHLSLLEQHDSPERQAILSRLRSLEIESICATIVSYEEQMRGWMSALSQARKLEQQIIYYSRLNRTLKGYCEYRVLDFNEQAAVTFQSIRKSCRRLGTMDLKIAAITLAWDAKLITRNTNDFSQVPGLKFEDWTK